MILYFENGRQVRGDVIQRAVLRSDLSPVPLSLEADLRSDPDTTPLLTEGKLLSTADGSAFHIVKSEPVTLNAVQGSRVMAAVRVTALYQPALKIAFVAERAVVLENSSIGAAYQACGATVVGVRSDVRVPRFTCLVGEVPSFGIRRAAHEAGGVLRWRKGVIEFLRYRDLLSSATDLVLPDVGGSQIDSGFLERHQIPTFISTTPEGGIISGHRDKARVVRYSHRKTQLQLNNMSRALVQVGSKKLPYQQELIAGMTVTVAGYKDPLVIVTAVHAVDQRAEPSQYTKLFLAKLEAV